MWCEGRVGASTGENDIAVREVTMLDAALGPCCGALGVAVPVVEVSGDVKSTGG